MSGVYDQKDHATPISYSSLSVSSTSAYHSYLIMPTLHAEWTTTALQPVYAFIIASCKRINLRLQCFLELAI
jgi:hypothetical protein